MPQKTFNTIKIAFKNKEYELDKFKLVKLINEYLNDNSIDINSNDKQIKEAMERHFLFDEVFLENINKL